MGGIGIIDEKYSFEGHLLTRNDPSVVRQLSGYLSTCLANKHDEIRVEIQL